MSSVDKQVFRDAVEEAVNGNRSLFEKDEKLIFIDPDDLNGSHSENISIIKKQIKEQAPKLAKDMTDRDYERIYQSTKKGPSANSLFIDDAAVNGVSVIVEPNKDIETKEDIVSGVSGIPVKYLKDIPGSDSIWTKMIGFHEGTHADQSGKTYNGIKEEIRADAGAIERLREDGHDDAAQALIDYRMIKSLITDNEVAEHSNGLGLFLIDSGIELKDIDNSKLYEANMDAKDIIFDVLKKEFGVDDMDDLAELFKDNPEGLVQAIEKASAAGAFNNSDNEYVQKYADAMIGAFRRQVKDVEPPKAELSSTAALEASPIELSAMQGSDPNIQAIVMDSDTPSQIQSLDDHGHEEAEQLIGKDAAFAVQSYDFSSPSAQAIGNDPSLTAEVSQIIALNDEIMPSQPISPPTQDPNIVMNSSNSLRQPNMSA